MVFVFLCTRAVTPGVSILEYSVSLVSHKKREKGIHAIHKELAEDRIVRQWVSQLDPIQFFQVTLIYLCRA